MLKQQPTGGIANGRMSLVKFRLQQKSVSLLKRAEASHADCRR
jgi:hypothetical protein